MGEIPESVNLSTGSGRTVRIGSHYRNGGLAVSELHAELSAFERRKKSERAEARQLAACQLAGGIDLAKALEAGPAERQLLLAKLARLIERERLRGMRRHWSYDLNRHIALKQAIDRLRASCAPPSLTTQRGRP